MVLLVDTSRVTQEQPLKSGNGTSRSSSRGRGGGRSWRVVVEEAAEVRLIIWPISGSLYTSEGWKSDKLAACLCCGHQSQELMEELRRLLGYRKVLLHTVLLLVRCAEVIWCIR